MRGTKPQLTVYRNQSRRVGIMTVDPAGRGGVWHMARSLHRLHQEWGIEAKIHFLPLIPGRYRDARIAKWRLDALADEGIPLIALPRPFLRASPIQQTAIAYLYRRYFETYDAWIVAAGSSNAGLPLALAGTPYFLWVATTLQDEIVAQAAIDTSSWAAQAPRKLLNALYKVEGMVYNRATSAAAISNYTARRVQETFPEVRVPVGAIAVPIDTNECRPTNKKKDNGATLIFTGRADDPRKDIGTLLIALRQLIAEFPAVRLLVVGSDAEIARKRAESAGVNAAVTFIPYVSRSELIQHYQIADVFVMASRQEGFGISLVEAMATGLPVVSTRCGAPEEIIQDDYDGFLVPSGDPNSLARAIAKLLRDPLLRRQFGANGRKKVENRYSWARIGADLKCALAQDFPKVYLDSA